MIFLGKDISFAITNRLYKYPKPYWSLDHLHALMPQFIDGPCNVHFGFLLDLFKNSINTPVLPTPALCMYKIMLWLYV